MTIYPCPVCGLPVGDGDRVSYGMHGFCAKKGRRRVAGLTYSA